MKPRFNHYIAISATIAGWIFAVGGCTTAEMSPQGPLPALPPPYVQVPHPGGYAISDLRAIFTTPGAPKIEDLKDCDSDFKKLRSLTQAQLELSEGSRELVRRDPVKYHWCFYGKILELENSIKAESYLDEKQKSVLDVYGSLTPMARAFLQEFHDSRYLRWAVKHYREVSEWVFYRKVELTPQTTSDLVEASNPFGLLKDPSGMVPVLEKYNIVRPDPVAASAAGAPPTAPSMVVPAAPASPTTSTTEAKTDTLVPPPSTQPSNDIPPPLPQGVDASVPPLPPDTPVAPDRQPATESVPPPASSTETVPPAAAAPATPPAETPPATPPAAQNEIAPSSGTSEAVLQGDSVAPASN